MNSEYLKLNKNILIAFAASITISAVAAQLLAEQADYLNTTYTLIVDYIVYFTVFSGLYYFDNRCKYKFDDGTIDNVWLRQDLVKIITSLGIGELVYTVARWLFQYYFLTIQYDPYLASLVSQGLATIIYMVVINLSVKIIKLFKDH